MANRFSRIVLLCEDAQHAYFARKFLIACGIIHTNEKITEKFVAKGTRSGEQFVRENYANEVQQHRKDRNRLKLGLVVMLDADTGSYAQHMDELGRTLADAKLPGRQPEEQIAIFIPKRNIQTWVHYLNGNAVDEENNYKLAVDRLTFKEWKPLIEQLAHNRMQPLPDDAPDSLKRACEELRRLTRVA